MSQEMGWTAQNHTKLVPRDAMRICSAVVLSYLDVVVEPQRLHK